MATQFQHRLVGTLILVAVGVIFLPDLLSGKQQLVPDEAVTIPLRPELTPVQPAIIEQPKPSTQDAESAALSPEVWTIEQAQEAPPVAPTAAVEPSHQAPVQAQPEPVATPQPAPQAPKPVEKPAPAPEPAPKPIAQPQSQPQQATAEQGDFVVQLGVFRNAENVNALVKKLQAAGYIAQTTPRVPKEGELNRVWVGPDTNKARLEQQIPALEQLTGLKGSVRAK